MFLLATVGESVRLSPSKLKNDFIQALHFSLSQKYCNRVIKDVGLCISIFDILETEDPYIYSGEAAIFVKVRFRVIVFRPFVGEVLVGRVRSGTEEGLSVTLGFFDDIHIPPGCLPQGTAFDPTEQVWCWHYEGNQMYLDPGEAIRFRILSEKFVESAPISKDVLMSQRAAALAAADPKAPSNPNIVTDIPAVPETTPYRIVATIAEDGLGLVRWWQPAEMEVDVAGDGDAPEGTDNVEDIEEATK